MARWCAGTTSRSMPPTRPSRPVGRWSKGLAGGRNNSIGPRRPSCEGTTRSTPSLCRLMLAQIAGMIEPARLQIRARRLDFGNGGLCQNLGSDVLSRAIGYLMDEADVPVLAGHDAGDDVAPGDFGIDDGFAAAPSVVDHHNEILHWRAHDAAVRSVPVGQYQYF